MYALAICDYVAIMVILMHLRNVLQNADHIEPSSLTHC
jgi:hypothetical protein